MTVGTFIDSVDEGLVDEYSVEPHFYLNRQTDSTYIPVSKYSKKLRTPKTNGRVAKRFKIIAGMNSPLETRCYTGWQTIYGMSDVRQ